MRCKCLFLCLILPVLAGCLQNKPAEWDIYLQELDQWKNQRVERLKSKDGWLNLAGLYWLEEGENTFGSDSSNSIIFPENAPSKIGSYMLDEDIIKFRADSGVEVKYGEKTVTESEIRTDRNGEATLLETGKLAWFIIQRGDRFGIRLRDYEHPALQEFSDIEYYKPDPDWIIKARLEAFEKPLDVLMPTVIGSFDTILCPGVLKFEICGLPQELLPGVTNKGFFIVFSDETNGLETYGGGRFMHTAPVDGKGRVILDFNKAYNPPCAYTPFATCPLPPRGNYLDVSVTAGEKFAGH